MNNKILKITLIIISILYFIFSLWYIIDNEYNKKYNKQQIVEIKDTIVIDKEIIKYKEKLKYITNYDTIIKLDTIKDSVLVYIPIEHKQYKDTFITDTSKTYLSIDYSGYKASIDNISFYSNYNIKPIEKNKTKGFGQFIGLSINVGYGIGLNYNDKSFNNSPYIGIGISYGWGYRW